MQQAGDDELVVVVALGLREPGALQRVPELIDRLAVVGQPSIERQVMMILVDGRRGRRSSNQGSV